MKTGFGKLACLLIASIAMGMMVCAAETNNIDELAKKNSVLQINSDAQLHGEPNENSAVTSALPAGTPVVIMEDGKDGWCKVSYRENEGYVQTSVLGMLGSPILPNAQNIQENTDAAESADTQDAENKAEDQSENNTEDKAENETENKAEDQSQASVLSDTDVSDADISGADSLGNTYALDNEFANVKEEGIQAYQEAENASAQLSSGIRWKVVIAVLVIAIFAVGIISKLRGNNGKR